MSRSEELQRPLQLEEDELEVYGDESIGSKDAKVPRWLKLTYVLLPIWGFFWMWSYINGSNGWLDRGYWNQLQKAALTTFPSGTIEGEAENLAEENAR